MPSTKSSSGSKTSSKELVDLLGALALDGQTKDRKSEQQVKSNIDTPNPTFLKELNLSSFEIFTPEQDLGFFEWAPDIFKGYKSMLDVASAKELQDQVILNGQPNTMIKLSTLRQKVPKRFATNMNSQTHNNEYPYKMPYIVPMYVAGCHRGLDLDTIDFVFGGSGLGCLAQREVKDSDDHRFIGYIVPNSKIIVVAKDKQYVKNYADFGHQFERLVTGGNFTDRHRETSIEHMHVMTVSGRYKVLFCAEVDTVVTSATSTKRSLDLVEVTTGNPRYFTSKVLQMISNGSSYLCAGSKYRGTLENIRMIPLSTLIDEVALSDRDVKTFESNILDGLNVLKQAHNKFTPGDVFEIKFRRGKTQLDKLRRHDILPSDHVIKDMLVKNEK